MSVLFGIWTFHHAGIADEYLAGIRATLSSYSSDGKSEHTGSDIHLIHLPFHVTRESEDESQPFVTPSGQVLLWDGRLDNRQELIGSLGKELRGDLTDVAIAAAALESWGTDGLRKLVGDWALSLWNPKEQSVVLAKDFLGARQLYYTVDRNSFAWSTLIDPLLLPNKPFQLQEEYLAGWLSQFPAAHLTPFAGIHAVPPSSAVFFRRAKITVRRYWDFDPGKRIRYRDDREYEEHFRNVFGESVRRRLRSSTPVLAELSGGMDSSSIVCMADALMARGFVETPRLDTISYFDDSETNWNELPFFARVEQQRGRAGRHVALDFRTQWRSSFDHRSFAATPGSGVRLNDKSGYHQSLRSGEYRVLLQGVGGDEVLGGVPAATPELADLLSAGNVRLFLRQLTAWALACKVPAFHLFADTIHQFLPPHRFFIGTIPWLRSDFARRNADVLRGYDRRFTVFGPQPSFQANLAALDSLRRQLASRGLSPGEKVERRYVYLDRDLLEFLYAIPREQLLRPGQRRSLMRRALVGIVPEEILKRKRKAFIARAPVVTIQQEWTYLQTLTENMVCACAGIVDAAAFRQSLRKASDGEDIPIVPALRTVLVEAWLAHLLRWDPGVSLREIRVGDRVIRPPGKIVQLRHSFS
jgi:asparagine synthase (glutamine-hydrolysing)